ncbi:hypothetical protein Taro_002898 [Colocasia esculenta]|uniref:Uncharacterized protein n=1 Tax=Colocasia esculenta TaxID=4460 RepID=A0A843TK41_COLES|nr:hypothetical protein [Colocasia esculenta]
MAKVFQSHRGRSDIEGLPVAQNLVRCRKTSSSTEGGATAGEMLSAENKDSFFSARQKGSYLTCLDVSRKHGSKARALGAGGRAPGDTGHRTSDVGCRTSPDARRRMPDAEQPNVDYRTPRAKSLT